MKIDLEALRGDLNPVHKLSDDGSLKLW